MRQNRLYNKHYYFKETKTIKDYYYYKQTNGHSDDQGIIPEDITIINIHVPNIGVPQYIREILADIKRRNQQ